MEVTAILGYIGALFIGLILGLIGGGGSILTVPILVYLLALNPVVATAYSLFVVGFSSLVGAVRNMQKGLVNYKVAAVFALPAFIAVYLTRRYLVPAIPEELFSINSFTLTKDIAIMVFFAIVMILASYAMIKKSTNKKDCVDCKMNYPVILIYGLFIGIITGLLGAGGGFLIIPALVLLAGLPMKEAVATSLLIIAINSLIGFLGDVQNLTINWVFLGIFTAISVVGIFIGIWLNKFIDEKKLKKAFGWFVLLMGIFIIYQELF